MEFLRYGSRIPGAYEWGCCAVDIIQNFNVDPDALSSVQIVSGDSATPFTDHKGEARYLGPTYRDIFNQRLRIGTFSDEDMPNHVFFAVMTDWQISTEYGKKWLAILKEAGFEFIRTTDNSVYSGSSLYGLEPVYDNDDEYYDDEDGESHPNHIFGLFRNIGMGRIQKPFQPPAAWLELSGGVDEVSSIITSSEQKQLEEQRFNYHTEQWNKLGRVTTLSEADLRAKGAPVILAGKFSANPQEPIERRKAREEVAKKVEETAKKSTTPIWKAI